MALTLFVTGCVLLGYQYLGYPLLLALLGRRIEADPPASTPVQRVAFVTAVYNEADRLPAKLANLAQIEIPAGVRIDVYITSDGSTDATHDVVTEAARSYPQLNLQLVVSEERIGKELAQERALQQVQADVVIFSDVATMLEPNVVETLCREFADPRIGAVSSIDRFIEQDGQPAGEGVYVKYEMMLRRLEERSGHLVGLSGSLFAARPEVCARWIPGVQSDFGTAISCYLEGQRSKSSPDVVGIYKDVQDPRKEYQRKVRTVLRGINGLNEVWPLLNPVRHGMFAVKLISHKLVRWLAPLALLFVLVGAGALRDEHPLFAAVFYLQLVCYGLALLGYVWRNRLTLVFHYFLSSHLAIAEAWWLFARGRNMVTWEPSKR